MLQNEDKFLWTEKWRPQKIEDVILPDYLKKPFQGFVDSGRIPNLILTGTPGVGKTSVARAMCEEIDADYILINSSLKNGIADLRVDIMGFATSVSLTGGRKVVILDEADKLTEATQRGLNGAIEEVAENCSFIFTCNNLNRIIDSLHSRCSVINFKLSGEDKVQMAAMFHKRVLIILEAENTKEHPLAYKQKVIAEFIMRFFPDYRRILNELQRYAVTGMIDEGILAKTGDTQIDELIRHMKKKDFRSIRQWVGANSDADSITILRSIYDKAYEIVKPNSVPVLVVLLGKYQDMAANVVDQEINLCAFIVECLCECEFV